MTDEELAAIKARRKEMMSDAMIAVWRRRATKAEAEVERLRAENRHHRETTINDKIEKIRELILEDEKFFQIVKDIKKNNNRYYIKDTYLDTPEWIIGAHDHRVFLLDEIERLREENRHHRVTTTNSVSKSLHDAAIAEQAVEIARLHQAHKAACEGGDLLREEIERLTRERDEARADAAALREALIDARDKVEWIGCSPEGQQEMNRMRDDCLCRIDAVLARAALEGGR